ncbi:hypothetical protein PIECOFPK_00214 [Mycovorax composti]|jgi:Predicted permeases|uniref:Probable membrane transporter protein n=2 Tax=Chitinophagaceae TaxID=563835 RepID=A0ABZ2EG90_9BACT
MGYLLALFIGLSLGLIGGGGSILTVPILVYLFDIPPVLATSYSLFIVGVTSFVGSITHWATNKLDMRMVLIFGLASVMTVFCIRHYIIPNLPQEISISGLSIPVSFITMMLFALLMIVSSFSMIRTHEHEQTSQHNTSVLKILGYGVGVGLVTGLLGAGGGFLLIPALVLLLRLPVKRAVGTSLLIITINSLIGFADDVTHHNMDWKLLLKITGVSIAGILIGIALGKRMDGSVLKKGFGWFVLLMGIYIIVHEISLITT